MGVLCSSPWVTSPPALLLIASCNQLQEIPILLEGGEGDQRSEAQVKKRKARAKLGKHAELQGGLGLVGCTPESGFVHVYSGKHLFIARAAVSRERI